MNEVAEKFAQKEMFGQQTLSTNNQMIINASEKRKKILSGS